MTITINLAVDAESDDEAERYIVSNFKRLVHEHWRKGKWVEGDTIKIHNYTVRPYHKQREYFG